jgi:hypothetical protein
MECPDKCSAAYKLQDLLHNNEELHAHLKGLMMRDLTEEEKRSGADFLDELLGGQSEE